MNLFPSLGQIEAGGKPVLRRESKPYSSSRPGSHGETETICHTRQPSWGRFFRISLKPCQRPIPAYLAARAGVPHPPMSASGCLFLQTSVFLREMRILRACQELRNHPAHGRRRRSPASGPSRSLSAMVADAWPSTITLAAGSRTDCSQVRSCTAGQPCPPRRAVRNTLTHAKTCQLKHRTPKNREIAVAAAHAEGKTAVTTTQKTAAPKDVNPKDASPMAANPAVASGKVAAPAKRDARIPESPSAARCQPLPPSHGGRR